MADRLLTYQLAAAVLAIWENDVRRFSPEEHFRWQTLLERLPVDLTPVQLRDALAPIAARNDKEQALFATLFEQARAEVEAVNEGTPDLTTFQKLSNLNPQHGFWKKYRWWFISAILLLAALAAIFFWPEKKPRVVKKEFAVTAGKVSRICPGEFHQIDSFDSRISSVKINYVTTHFSPALIGLTDNVEKEGVKVPPALLAIWNTHLAVITVENDSCISYTARDSVTGMDSIAARLTFSNGQQCDLQLRVTVAPAVGFDTLTDDTGTEPTITYRFAAHKPPFDHDQLLKNLEFNPADPLVAFLVRWANWINAILLVVFAALLYWWVQRRARRRRKLVAQRDKSAKPPYVWNIRIKNLAPPDPGDAFGLTINSLRRRTEDETRLIDLSETVRATIQKGGMAAFRFRQQTRPPEYLMLVDRQNAHDHRARLYDDLYHIMRQNEVLTERFFFDGDIRLCHNEQYPDGLTLDELLFRFPAHRLLIISSGRQLFSATTGRLNKWTEQFARWKDRALLSPLSAADWGRRERALSELFRFAPASLPGLRRLLEAFEADEEQHAPQLEKLAALAIGEPVLLEEGDLLQTLEKHFPDEHTRTWIAACALWPELHYDLTLWIGHWLAQESGWHLVDRPEGSAGT